ncbi:MAG: iron donor protein CyaY [Betaproteobacteria bacterium]|nr:iron donor protein CyaY [Betaproteobacteria bacterium]NBY05307.1 iron donor protein CyaY [Betaproteobacteria bacterium]
MNDTEFMNQAEALLLGVERHCDRINENTDADIDNQRVGGMVTLVFANRSQIVINLQKPLHEVWLASRSGGYHYRHDGLAWVDTKGKGNFWAQLSADATAQAGFPLDFSS